MKTVLKRAIFSALSFLGSIYHTDGVSVIVIHSVDDKDSLISTPTAMFKAQMEYLSENRISVITLKELYSRLSSSGPLPKKTVALTFDDGFEGVYNNAFPILKEYGYPATLFAVTDYVGRNMEWERVDGIHAYALCSWEKLRAMDQGGIDIQSHTKTHPFLSELDEEGIASEIEGSKIAIEENLDKKVEFLAYPYGDFNARVIDYLRKYAMTGAVSTTFGKARKGQDPYAIKRVGTEIVSGRDIDMLMHFFKACVSGTAASYVHLRNLVPLVVSRQERSDYIKH